MSPTPAHYSLRSARKEDRAQIQRFIQSPAHTHRHLDWRDPLDWLGRDAYWILERSGEIEGVLACITDPEEVAWVRLFAVESRLSPAWAWNILFERVYSHFASLPKRPVIASLGLQDWLTDMIAANGFTHFQDIIVLSYDGTPGHEPARDPSVTLRPMQKSDVAAVTRIDNQAFEPIWRLSADDLARAYERSSFRTVLEIDGAVVGYQMSAHNGFTAHLSRLAVDPAYQRRRIGYRLVQSVLDHFINKHGSWSVTLNTQDNNAASLALYQQVGFKLTGERFPVYVFPYRD